MVDLLPRNVADEHPVPILVFISGHIIRAIEKVHELALIHEVQHSLGASVTFTFKFQSTPLNNTIVILYHYLTTDHEHIRFGQTL